MRLKWFDVKFTHITHDGEILYNCHGKVDAGNEKDAKQKFLSTRKEYFDNLKRNDKTIIQEIKESDSGFVVFI